MPLRSSNRDSDSMHILRRLSLPNSSGKVSFYVRESAARACNSQNGLFTVDSESIDPESMAARAVREG